MEFYTSYNSDAFLLLLIVVAVFIIISIVVIVFSSIGISQIIIPKDATVVNPDLIPCVSRDVMNAYVRNYPNKTDCPQWSNELIVRADRKLYVKTLVQERCCYFDDMSGEEVLFPEYCYFPLSPVNIADVNRNPYVFANNTLFVNIPERYTLKYVETIGQNAIYTYQQQPNYTFQLGTSCTPIVQIVQGTQIIGSNTNGTFTFNIPISQIPPEIIEIAQSFNSRYNLPYPALTNPL